MQYHKHLLHAVLYNEQARKLHLFHVSKYHEFPVDILQTVYLNQNYIFYLKP